MYSQGDTLLSFTLNILRERLESPIVRFPFFVIIAPTFFYKTIQLVSYIFTERLKQNVEINKEKNMFTHFTFVYINIKGFHSKIHIPSMCQQKHMTRNRLSINIAYDDAKQQMTLLYWILETTLYDCT